MTTEAAHRSALLTLSGALDISTRLTLTVAVEEACALRPWLVWLDLHDVTFIDLAGLRSIGAARARLQSQSCALDLRAPSAPVRRLLALTGLAGLMGSGRDGTVAA